MIVLQKRVLLAIVLLGVAAVLRLYGFDYGIALLFYQHDEPQIVLRALRFGTGDLNPHIFWWPGTFQMELMAVVYGVMYAFGRLAGTFSSSHDFGLFYFRNHVPFYLLGRLVSLGFGLAGMWITYAIARRYLSWMVAVLALLFLATNHQHVELSRTVRPESPAIFFMALSVWSSLRILEDRSHRWYILAGLFAGAAAANLYYGGLVLIAMLIAHLAGRAAPNATWQKGGTWRRPVYGVLTCLAAFVIICPYSILDFATFRADTLGALGTYSGTSAPGGGEMLGSVVAALRSTLGSLKDLLALPLLLAAIAGLVLGLWRHTRKDIVLCGFTLCYVIVMGLVPKHNVHHLAPILPFLAILAGTAVVRVANLLPGGTMRPVAVCAIGVILVIPSVMGVIKADTERGREDTRQVAKEWIEANIPRRTKIVLDASVFLNTQTAPLAESRENLEARISNLRSGEAGGYGWTAGYAGYYEMKLATLDSTAVTYNVWVTDTGLNVRPVEYFRENGYRYIMIKAGVARRFLQEDMAARYPESAAFYGSLDSLCTLVREFAPEPWVRAGPTIKLYRIDR